MLVAFLSNVESLFESAAGNRAALQPGPGGPRGPPPRATDVYLSHTAAAGHRHDSLIRIGRAAAVAAGKQRLPPDPGLGNAVVLHRVAEK